MKHLLLMSVLTAAISACISPPTYAPMGSKDSPLYGYAETQKDDQSYVLKTVYPAEGMARNYWDQRAAELCDSHDYKKQIFNAIRPTIHYESYGGRAGNFVLEGFLTCPVAAVLNVEVAVDPEASSSQPEMSD